MLDDVYTTLANLTFIPHTSIKRGPHQINGTAIPCKRDPAVLRLMEMLPYVDSFEIEEPDWLFGGHFMDYRRYDHLQEGCDPLRASSYWDYMTPHTLALTNWGTGGWNNDNTWVLLYDAERYAMRVYDGQLWILRSRHSESGDERNGMNIFIEAPNSVWARIDDQKPEWFDPPTLLRRMIGAYQTTAWSPWEVSNREDGWGVDSSTIKDLSRKNGWPDNFDSDQFNVDLIRFRARYKLPQHGYASDAYKRITDLQGAVGTPDSHSPSDIPSGFIFHTKARLTRLEQQLAGATDEDEQWLLKWGVQRTKWDLERGEADLKEAKEVFQRLCPTDVCYKDKDSILWEFRALEKEFEKSKFDLEAASKCRTHVETLPEWAPPDPDRIQNCVAQVELKKHWLFLAYSQSKAEAVEYCAKTNCTLLPSDTLEGRVTATIEKLKREYGYAEDRVSKMVIWEQNLPTHATKAIEDFRIWESAVSNERGYIREKIGWLTEQLAEGGDRGRLWECLDDPKCI